MKSPLANTQQKVEK